MDPLAVLRGSACRHRVIKPGIKASAYSTPRASQLTVREVTECVN